MQNLQPLTSSAEHHSLGYGCCCLRLCDPCFLRDHSFVTDDLNFAIQNRLLAAVRCQRGLVTLPVGLPTLNGIRRIRCENDSIIGEVLEEFRLSLAKCGL